MEFVAKTDVGQKRSNNEDNYYIKKYSERLAVVIVADGLGGYESGEVASKMLVDNFAQNIEKDIDKISCMLEQDVIDYLNKLLTDTNNLIYDLEKTDEKYKGMGTTVVFFLSIKEKIYYFSVGDSRIYYIDESMNSIRQITEDDTYVNELLKTNVIDKVEAANHPKKHMLTKAIGVFKNVSTSIFVENKMSGYLLLCSDGLYNMVKTEDILEILKNNEFADIANKLIIKANNNGGIDNITVVAIKL